MTNLKGYIALGRIAFENIVRSYRAKGLDIPRYEFKHGGVYRLGDGLPLLLATYHPSQQNTLTGRLTVSMFDQIWQKAITLLE